MIEPRRIKILLITRNLPPLVGGMERLNWFMVRELTLRADVRVVGPTGSGTCAPEGAHVAEVALRPLWRFLLAAAFRALALARRWKPAVVIAGSGLTSLPALLVARLVGARMAVYVHGLDLTVKHPVYRALWLPALRRADRVIANSQATATLARAIGVADHRIGIVHPGVELPSAASEQIDIRKSWIDLELRNRPVLLSVGRLSARKGLREFVAKALPDIVKACPQVVLLIIGGTPADALHAEAQTPESIRDTARDVGVEANLRFLGVVEDYRLLSAAYQSAAVHVFPVRQIPSDPEGFGMVAIEAASHGLPTVAFGTGGVVDAVAEGRSGRLIAPDNYDLFAQAVIELLASEGQWAAACRDFARGFAWPEFGNRLMTQLTRDAAGG